MRKRDFSYVEKGIRADKESEFMIAGRVEYSQKLNRMLMKKPDIVIGSDRLELYEFFGRRKETFQLQNRNWLKFCVVITGLHFLLVRVPSLFSRYFGDEVGEVSSKLGASNESKIGEKIPSQKEQ